MGKVYLFWKYRIRWVTLDRLLSPRTGPIPTVELHIATADLNVSKV